MEDLITGIQQAMGDPLMPVDDDGKVQDQSPSLYRDQVRVYEYWWNKLRWAMEELQLETNSAKWQQNYKRLQHQACVKVGSQKFQSPNEIGIAMEELIAMCYPATPLPGCTADTPESEELLPVYEWLLFSELRKPANKRTVMSWIQDAACSRYGYLKATYQADPQNQDNNEVDEMTLAQQMAQIAGMEHPAMMAGQPVPIGPNDIHWVHIDQHKQYLMTLDPDSPMYWVLSVHLNEHQMARSMICKPGKIKIDRVSPRDFLYDPDAKTWESQQWIAERTFEHIEDLKRDPLLQNVAGVQPGSARQSDPNAPLQPNPRSYTPGYNRDLTPTQEIPSYVEVWRIHDRRNNLLIVLARDHKWKTPLFVGQWPYQCPVYFRLDLNPANEDYEQMTLMDRVWPLQVQLDQVWARWLLHVNKYGVRKIFVEEGVQTPTFTAQFNDPEKTIVNLKPGDSTKMTPFDPAATPTSLKELIDELTQRIRRTLGVWETLSGVPKSQTATEAQLMASQQSQKTNRKQEIVAEVLGEVCYTILQLHKQFTTTEMIVQMRGPDGMNWRLIRPEQIPEEIHVTIDNWSWGTPNPDLRRRQLTELAPFVINNPYINQPAWWTEMFRAQGFRNPEKYVTRPPMFPPQIPGNPSPPKNGPPEGMGQTAGNAVGMQAR